MSQFDSLSPSFRESLDSLANSIKEKREAAAKTDNDFGSMSKLAANFAEHPIMAWYLSMDEDDRREIRRVFAELSAFKPSEILAMMKAEGHITPMGFIDSLFSSADKNQQDDEVITEEDSSDTEKK